MGRSHRSPPGESQRARLRRTSCARRRSSSPPAGTRCRACRTRTPALGLALTKTAVDPSLSRPAKVASPLQEQAPFSRRRQPGGSVPPPAPVPDDDVQCRSSLRCVSSRVPPLVIVVRGDGHRVIRMDEDPSISRQATITGKRFRAQCDQTGHTGFTLRRMHSSSGRSDADVMARLGPSWRRGRPQCCPGVGRRMRRDDDASTGGGTPTNGARRRVRPTQTARALRAVQRTTCALTSRP